MIPSQDPVTPPHDPAAPQLDPMAPPQDPAALRLDPVAAIAGGLVVSCQAPEGHPLRVPSVIARLAACAALGGAAAVRVNHPDDVRAVKSVVDLPVIALHKERAADRDLITPRWELVESLAAAGADVVAVEATGRGELPVDALVARVHGQLGLPVMADVATVDQGTAAWAAGADLVATTLSGYTPDSPRQEAPDLDLVAALTAAGVRVVAEGRFATPDQVRAAFAAGAYATVVGTAITDPVALTRGLAAAAPRPASPTSPTGPTGPTGAAGADSSASLAGQH
ncbi:putative N-acetylmannosamine-6-phosphate 2-epimerase [Solwaraspora sp. WMMD792]|uniref:putative N-acetylmannosamine-6-phosphate 2-epimerase n=1 Tax=Solwaraspora sp. WMMD792 TaxID=3016099 RepID=UPI002416493E|nr:putative N-acetylmannosamine-6-phosphate 2-epimerase [Solwaraspora sp. WMMD792]MDG4774955.1 putative N-acetylmannosamine-6-phosphate 2-epimerase [Solwaraspora sp. WMMD792]